MQELKTHCEYCGSEILYPHPELDSYFCSSDYEPNFPGWCHSCLVEHCVSTNCLQCELRKYPDCEFISTKKIYLEED